jgi:Protein of unknown function (DUF3618)/Putative Actinobacterial Holin-X, holin superfamily III
VESSADVAQYPGQDHSTSELVKQLSEQVSVFIRDELKLAQVEMTREGKQAGVGVGLLGGSGPAPRPGGRRSADSRASARTGGAAGSPPDDGTPQTAAADDAQSTPPDDVQELQLEIEQTREQLGDTVEQLVAKADVKARAQDKAARRAG